MSLSSFLPAFHVDLDINFCTNFYEYSLQPYWSSSLTRLNLRMWKSAESRLEKYGQGNGWMVPSLWEKVIVVLLASLSLNLAHFPYSPVLSLRHLALSQRPILSYFLLVLNSHSAVYGKAVYLDRKIIYQLEHLLTCSKMLFLQL